MEREKYQDVAFLIKELSPGILADLLLPRVKGEGAYLNFEIRGRSEGVNYCLGFEHSGKQKLKNPKEWKFDEACVFSASDNIDGGEPPTLDRDQVVEYLNSLGFDGEVALEELLKTALKKAAKAGYRTK